MPHRVIYFSVFFSHAIGMLKNDKSKLELKGKKNCGDDFDKKLKLEHVNDWKGNLLLVLDNACNIIC